MTALIEAMPVDEAAHADPATRSRRLGPWHYGVALLAFLSGIAYLWMLQNGAYSQYYASIAISMSQNWSNWFFGAMDPAGTVSLDKIPGSYWIPALFVKALGFSTWSVNAPNAIATVVAVVIVAFTAKRLAGPVAGLIAGAVAASTPIVAAVARSNEPESFFVLGLALVAWASVKALQRGSFRWLLVAGALIAVSFQTYMLEAWAVWPALAIAWLLVRKPWLTKLWQLAVAGAASLLLSVAWIFAVSLVPADARPYVGSTYSNSPWEMVFGYNGLGRFGASTASSDYRSFTPPFSGDPGLFRLFNPQLAGQIGWLLPTAALAVVVLAVLRFSRPMTTFLGGWLVTLFAMFSLVAGMHQFYTAALAVPVALLVGVAFAHARARDVRWAQIALLATAGLSALVVGAEYSAYLLWAAVAQAVLAAVAIALIATGSGRSSLRASRWVAAVSAAGLVFAPVVWTFDVMNHPNSVNPVAGDGSAAMSGFGGFGNAGGPGGFASAQGSRPGGTGGALGGTRPGPGRGGGQIGAGPGGSRQGGPGAQGAGPGGFAFGGGQGGGGEVNSDVLAYIQEHATGQRYLMAAFGAQAAAPYITASGGGSVLPIGGFNGGDPVPTLAAFTRLVAVGDLSYVLLGGRDAGPTGNAGTSSSAQIRSWVSETCAPVDGLTSLYECTPASAG